MHAPSGSLGLWVLCCLCNVCLKSESGSSPFCPFSGLSPSLYPRFSFSLVSTASSFFQKCPLALLLPSPSRPRPRLPFPFLFLLPSLVLLLFLASSTSVPLTPLDSTFLLALTPFKPPFSLHSIFPSPPLSPTSFHSLFPKLFLCFTLYSYIWWLQSMGSLGVRHD